VARRSRRRRPRRRRRVREQARRERRRRDARWLSQEPEASALRDGHCLCKQSLGYSALGADAGQGPVGSALGAEVFSSWSRRGPRAGWISSWSRRGPRAGWISSWSRRIALGPASYAAPGADAGRGPEESGRGPDLRGEISARCRAVFAAEGHTSIADRQRACGRLDVRPARRRRRCDVGLPEATGPQTSAGPHPRGGAVLGGGLASVHHVQLASEPPR
jgi:hypothetical protein